MCLGVPVKIEKIEGAAAVVRAGAIRRRIGIELVSGVKPGDYVLLHAGFAIQKIDEKEARETLRLLKTMAEPTTERRKTPGHKV